MTTTKKPQYKPEKVVKDDGTVVNICRCSFADTDTLLQIQDRLVEAYVKCDGAIGAIIGNEETQADLRSICSLLPLEQKTKGGEVQYLDFDDISDNWEQLVALFFNGSIDQNTRNVPDLAPSKVSQLHFLPYAQMIKKHIKAQQEKETENNSQG